MLSVNITFRKLLNYLERCTTGKFNLMKFPTIAITGAASTNQIEDRAVTSAKVEMTGPWFKGTDSGTATAHAVTIDSDATDYEDGQLVIYKVNATCTGAPLTLALTGNNGAFTGGAKELYVEGTVVPRPGQLRNGGYVLARYNGSFDWFNIISILHSADVTKAVHDATSTADTWVIESEETGGLGQTYAAWQSLTEAVAKLLLVTAEDVNTGAMTLNYNSTGAKAMRTPDDLAIAPGQVVAGMQLMLTYNPAFNSAAGAWVVLSPLVQPDARVIAPVRQTVLSGPVDSNGHPVLLTYSGLNVTLKATGTDPLVAAIAAGFDASGTVDYVLRLTADVSNAWTLGSDGTYYLYADRDSSTGAITYGSTTSRPIYTEDDAAATTNGLHTFLINRMKMYAGNGTTAAEVQRVFFGEAVVSGGAVTSVVSYMFAGRYKSATDQAISAANTTYTDTHKLGLRPQRVRWVLVNQTAEGDIAQTNEMDISSVVSDSTFMTATSFYSETASKLAVMWSTYAPRIYEPASGTPAHTALTFGNWKLRHYAERGW